MAATQPLNIILSCPKRAFIAQTPLFKAVIYDGNGALVAPGTSVTITITGPMGAALATAAAMSTASTGIYTYASYTIPAAPVTGTARWKVAATDTAIVTTVESTIEVMGR